MPGWALPVALGVAVLAGCGGGGGSGGGGDPDDDEPETASVTGNATKGPLANASVSVFELDAGEDDLRGAEVASGSTNDAAAIEADIPADTEGLLLVAVSAGDDTTDLTTGESPVLSELSTVTDADDWLAGEPVYATPLSHMAVEIAARNIPEDAGRGRVGSALARAQEAVRGTVGFGLLEDDAGEPIDLFTTAPILTDAAEDADARGRTLRYRKASEAVAAVMAEVAGSTDAAEIEALFDDVIDDLSTGRIDDDDVGSQLEQAEPESLVIPNEPDGRTIAATRDIVNEEREAVGTGDDVDDVTSEDDAPSQPAQRDSGLTSDDLAGETVEVTLAASPSDGGDVTTADGEPLGDGAFEVGVDDTITVRASPADGFDFARWLDDGTSEAVAARAEYTFEVEAGRGLTAEFVEQSSLTLLADPADGGEPAGAGDFEPGEEVTVEANPNNGYAFEAWVDEDLVEQSVDAEYTFEMPGEAFELTAQYALTAAGPNDSDAGSVEVDGAFADGEEVTLTAVPSSGFDFVEWQDADGNQASTEAEYTFTYSDGDELTAVFEPQGDVAVWGEFGWGDGSVWAPE